MAVTQKKSFKNQSWKVRVQSLGDQAEGEFEKRETGYARSGWNRPDFTMGKLNKNVCYMPDYMMDVKGYPQWVEVQGCGEDQLFKFKTDKLEALKWWQSISQHTVYVWLWDATNKDVYFLNIDQLWDIALKPSKHNATRGRYPEGKDYMAIPVQTFRDLQYGRA